MESHREEGLEDNSELEDSKPKPVLKESAGAQKLPLKSREVLAVLTSLHYFQRECVCVCGGGVVTGHREILVVLTSLHCFGGGGHRPLIGTSSVGLIALLWGVGEVTGHRY